MTMTSHFLKPTDSILFE